MAKLTLTLKESTIKKAKIYAENTGRSLSGLVEDYLEMLVKSQIDKEQLSRKLRKIAGAVKLPDDFDEKKALNAYFENKHL